MRRTSSSSQQPQQPQQSRRNSQQQLTNEQRNEEENERRRNQITSIIQNDERKRKDAFQESQRVVLPPRPPTFYKGLKGLLNGTNGVFNTFGIPRHIFKECKKILSEVNLHHRGKIGYIHSLEDRIISLLIYLKSGNIEIVRVSCKGRLINNSSIQAVLNESAMKFRDVLVNSCIEFRNETLQGTNVSSVIDCTVIQTQKPSDDYKTAKIQFSGKHYMYCHKKEVVVNVTSGTACYISPARPGSVHDFTIFKDTFKEIEKVIGNSTLIADKGYVGIEKVMNNAHVAQVGSEQNQRQIVERYFGRLKSLFGLMRNKFRLSYELFDVYFDIACCLTNLDILYRPLDAVDLANYRNYQNNIREKLEEKRKKKLEANRKYRERRREENDSFTFENEMSTETDEDTLSEDSFSDENSIFDDDF